MKELLDLIGDPNRVILSGIEEKYLSDTLGRRKGTAAALVFPTSTQEVSRVMKFAWEHHFPVTPRGAGTNLVGSTVPAGQGIILDLSRMNHILKLDEDTFTATVEPGVVLQDFQKYVEERGFFYPPDPGEKTATIGGNISTNAGGMRAVKYGVTRDCVRGLEVVLADGTILTLGSKNVKDASGLSLRHLMIGSEGTLAVITKCVLKLVSKPEASLSVVIPYADLKAAIASVPAILKSSVNPTAVEFIERSVVELGERFTGLSFPRPDAQAYVLLTFDGHESEIAAGSNKIREVSAACGALDYIPLETQERAAEIWKIRGCLVKSVEATSEQEPVDLVVPINRTAEFVAFVHETESKVGMQMIAFGHAGDGNVHLCVVRGNRNADTWARELHENMEAIYGKAYELGGLTSGEHGIGLSKRPYYLKYTPEENLSVQRSIKTALDPRHILNDHKSYLE